MPASDKDVFARLDRLPRPVFATQPLRAEAVFAMYDEEGPTDRQVQPSQHFR